MKRVSMSELEELQRCLEGTAGSDSEESGSHAVLATDFKISEKAVESSLTNENKNEGTGSVQDPASSSPSLEQPVCKNSNNVSTTEKIVADSGHSAAEYTTQVSKLQALSLESSASEGLFSKCYGKEANTTSTNRVTVKNVSSDSRMLQTNIRKGSFSVQGSDTKTITDTSAKKACPTKHLKLPILKQDALEVPSSKPQDMKVLTCNISSTSGTSKCLLNDDVQSASADKMEKESVVSESKIFPISSPALASEKVSSLKFFELKDKNDVSHSPLRTLGDPLELKVNVNKPKVVVKQAQFIVSAKDKLEKVKLPSTTVKTHASDRCLLLCNKRKSESSTLWHPSCSTLKPSIMYIKKTSGTGSSLHSDHHTGKSETTGRVQPAPGRSVFSLDSKMSRLEEVKITNNRPVVRLLNASPDSDKIKSATAGASVSSASLFVIRKGNVPKEGGPANTSPVVMKRKRSFETGTVVAYGPREECPSVSHDTSKHMKLRKLEVTDVEQNMKKQKFSTGVISMSSNTATLQEVAKDNLLPMSVESVKKEHEELIAPEISRRAEEQILPDGSINERKSSVTSENGLVKCATFHQNSEKHVQEVCTKLELKERIVIDASKPKAVTRTADTPLVRRRRPLSDTFVFGSKDFVVSQEKRRKLSATEINGMDEGTLKTEPVVETAGSIKVVRSAPTRRVPITSAMEVTILSHGVEQDVQTIPVCKSEGCEVYADDLEVAKDGPGKEFMQAKVVLKKLNIPVPGCLLSPPAQVKAVAKINPQTLQKTLENVSVVLQATLPESSEGNKELLEMKKLKNELIEPVKRKKVMKGEVLQRKVTRKPTHKIMVKQAQQKVVRKQTQQKIMGKENQKRIVRKQAAQKIMGRQNKQKVVGKQTQQKIIRKHTQQGSMGKQNKQAVIGKQGQQKTVGRQASQRIIRKQNQQKIMKKLSQHTVIVRPSQHKYVGKSQHKKVVGKSSQQKVIGRANPQKITTKPVQQQKTISKPKSIQKTLPRSLPSIAVRIASKRKKKNEMPKKMISSGNKTKPQKVEPSIISKRPVNAVSFGNLKYRQVMKSASKPEAEKRIITMKEKNVTINKSKKNQFDGKEGMSVPQKNEKVTSQVRKEDMEPLEMKVIQSVIKTVNTIQQEKPAAVKRLPGPKKIVSDDKKMKKLQENVIKSGEPNGCNTAADDEWIVEVLLDDNEIDMMTISSQVQVGQDTYSGSVSSSDDKPKDLYVSASDLDGSRLLECDSSTDLNRRNEAVDGGGEVRRNISSSRSNSCRTTLNTYMKQKVPVPRVKQVTSSVNNDKRTGISAEQKVAEMRKAIGDLERIADRCMLRLKAEERQVLCLTNKLHQYENDKHYNMLTKILKDAAPGPKQNPHAEFILDLLLSYCPEDDDSGCPETLQAAV